MTFNHLIKVKHVIKNAFGGREGGEFKQVLKDHPLGEELEWNIIGEEEEGNGREDSGEEATL